jgi:hypothetical protein
MLSDRTFVIAAVAHAFNLTEESFAVVHDAVRRRETQAQPRNFPGRRELPEASTPRRSTRSARPPRRSWRDARGSASRPGSHGRASRRRR